MHRQDRREIVILSDYNYLLQLLKVLSVWQLYTYRRLIAVRVMNFDLNHLQKHADR
jgi:hypothetical protein